MKKKTEQEKFWDALSKELPPPYAMVEERTRDHIRERIDHIKTLDPKGRDISWRHSNSEMLEYYEKQLETYRIIRPSEIEEREEKNTISDMNDILGRLPK